MRGGSGSEGVSSAECGSAWSRKAERWTATRRRRGLRERSRSRTSVARTMPMLPVWTLKPHPGGMRWK
eukprot:10685221-Alexandrium_andersonii.AAC.1